MKRRTLAPLLFGLLFAVAVQIVTPNGFTYLRALIFGVNTKIITSHSLVLLDEIHTPMVRLDAFPWDAVEYTEGTYDFSIPDAAVAWAQRGNIGILGIIQYAPWWASGVPRMTPDPHSSECGIPSQEKIRNSYDDIRATPPQRVDAFARYVAALVKRYPSVRYWQIWNEPNTQLFWKPAPDPAAYAVLLKAAYRAAKKTNPHVQIVLGGISSNDQGYIDGLYRAGGKSYFDIMAVHPYDTSQDPDAYLSAELTSVRGLMMKWSDAKPIWLTEIGWPTNIVSEDQQAAYLQKVYDIASSKQYVGAVFWHTLADCNSPNYDPTNSEHNFGIFRNGFSHKKAAEVFRGIQLR